MRFECWRARCRLGQRQTIIEVAGLAILIKGLKWVEVANVSLKKESKANTSTRGDTVAWTILRKDVLMT